MAKDCSNVDALPPFIIGIDGFDYVLEPNDYVIRKDGKCESPFVLAEIPAPYDRNLFIGMPLLKKFYLNVDMKNDTVTFQRDKATKHSSFTQ